MAHLPRCRLGLLALLLTACAARGAGASRPVIARASRGDMVWVILNHVKPDKRQQFERFLHQQLWPMGHRVGQKDPVIARVFDQTRVLHPTEANEDGTYTYAFLMDPVVAEGDYAIQALLKRGFPEVEADQLFKEGFESALARPQENYVLRQSPD